ncbi:single-stranded-DNA-specific exonuclease RecJ [candidate division KSB1 bacterium]
MELKWVLEKNFDEALVEKLSESLNVSHVISKILIQRGIDSFTKAREFFRPDFKYLHDPFLMADMDKAVERINAALRNKEKILIYGDYDVDGITSVSMVYMFLKGLYADVIFYIPDRLKDGYGLSISGLEEAYKKGVSLVISVDCGITAVNEIKFAKEKNIDVIVCDHHEPGEVLPDAYAVLDPKRGQCSYPFKELAGVGVAFKLIQAMHKDMNFHTDTLHDFIDLVAIGSSADIVPLVGENRILVKKGLEKLNYDQSIGMKALIYTSGLSDKVIGTGQVVFVLAPRINAVGRLGDAERAAHLLTSTDYKEAHSIAKILETENIERKTIDDVTFRNADKMMREKVDPKKEKSIVLFEEKWHPGVIGIVASRIVEKYYRPTILISVEDGIGKGSARSIEGFDIYDAIKQCSKFLKEYGGHKYAAGLTIKQENIEKFIKEFKKVSKDLITDELLIQKLKIDAELEFDEINTKLINVLKQFTPYGPQNMRPVFISRNLEVVEGPTIVGANHLKFKARKNRMVFDAIGFNLGEKISIIEPGVANLNMVYVIEENSYFGKNSIQLRVKDIKINYNSDYI